MEGLNILLTYIKVKRIKDLNILLSYEKDNKIGILSKKLSGI